MTCTQTAEQLDAARVDYASFLVEYALTDAFVRAVAEDLSDHVDLPSNAKEIVVGPSAIEGRGIFTAVGIDAHAPIAPARIGDKRTIVGRRTNHSTSPNCRYVARGAFLVLVANRRIEAGEELTIDYRQAAAVNTSAGLLPFAALPVGPSIRAYVERLENMLLTMPQVDLGTTHALSGGIYARTVVIPEGCTLTGAVHSKDHINVLTGDITVLTEEGTKRLTGFHVLPTKAGMKRAGYAHALTTWTTLVRTELTDIEAIEDEITPESDRLQTRRLAIAGAKAPALEK